MINVVICENDINVVNKIINIIDQCNKECSKAEMIFQIELIKENEEGVIEHVQENVSKKNLYILDIELDNGDNGMQLARKIRKYDQKGDIIFITNHTVMAMYVFKYKLNVLDFIEKIDSMEIRLGEDLKQIYEKYIPKTEEEVLLTLKSGTINQVLKLSEIIYFQTTGINRKIKVVTIHGEFQFCGRLKEIERDLDDRFHKSHRACIINKDYIKEINTDPYDLYVHMKNGEKTLLSRGGLKGLINNE